jgi:hypothetical protein
MVIGDFWNVTRSQVYRELRTLEGLERSARLRDVDAVPARVTLTQCPPA